MKQWYKWTFADGYCVITRFSVKKEREHTMKIKNGPEIFEVNHVKQITHNNNALIMIRADDANKKIIVTASSSRQVDTYLNELLQYGYTDVTLSSCVYTNHRDIKTFLKQYQKG